MGTLRVGYITTFGGEKEEKRYLASNYYYSFFEEEGGWGASGGGGARLHSPISGRRVHDKRKQIRVPSLPVLGKGK
jgi:hypothetical protein